MTTPAMVAGTLKARKIKLSNGQAGNVLAYLLDGFETVGIVCTVPFNFSKFMPASSIQVLVD